MSDDLQHQDGWLTTEDVHLWARYYGSLWADWLRTQRHDHDAALAAELAERAEMLGLEP